MHHQLTKILQYFGHVLQLEEKTKPAQHSVGGLRSLGLTPNTLSCHSTTDQTDEFPDQISELTDEVLAYILLCKLSPKEAARMCSVSHKWRSLYWKFTRNLFFNDGFENLNTNLLEDEDGVRQSSFVKHVNESLKSNEVGVVEQLRIRCGLDNCFQQEIDQFIKSAFSKQVEIFDLDLLVPHQKGGGCGYYTLTRELFIGIEGFISLEELRLKGVDINEEVVSLLFNYCTNLKQLAIVNSPSLVSIKVTGREKSMLRHLELSGWFKSVEIINVISLVSLTLYENNSEEGTVGLKLRVENVPSLVDLHIGGGFADSYMEGTMYDLFTNLSASLKSLTVKITSTMYFRGGPPFMPIMTCVEKFVLQTMYHYSSCHLVNMMTVLLPSLREFVLQAAWIWTEGMDIEKEFPDRDFWVSDPNCTKEVKIAGYYGSYEDVGLASFFLKCGVGIERLTVDPHDQTNALLGRPPPNYEDCESDNERAARARAYKQLPGKVRPGVELVIL